MSLEFRELRHVLALADLGSFARAAGAMRLSQPALSRSIQGVEGKLGTPLFERLRSGTVPTDAGRLLILRARQIVQMAESLDRQVFAEREQQHEHVCVGVGPYPAQTIMSLALARLISTSPGVTAQLLVGNWDDLLRSLQRQDIEFFVAETSTLEKDSRLVIEPMAAHPLFFVARSGHPLAGRRGVTAAEAFAHPLVSLSRISPRVLEPMRAARHKAREQGALAHSFPAVECNALGVVLQIVRNSDAIMVATLPSVSNEIESGELVALGSERWLHLRYGIVRLKGHAPGVAAEKLIELVREAERVTTLEEKRLVTRWARSGRRTRAPAGARRKRPQRDAA
jgi:DNA-binding transcriptional LysR family regulator